MLENFNEDKRKNSTTQFSDFHTGWSINCTHKNHILKNEDQVFEISGDWERFHHH